MDETWENRMSGDIVDYIRLANLALGLLLGFAVNRIEDGLTRLVNDLPE